jgi:hypothetical protein
MAIGDNFIFSDPALNAQAVARIQAQAAVEAARNQQFAATLSEMRRQRTEQSDKEERRGIREADIRRLDAQEAERRRQFDAGLGFSEKDLATRERIAGAGETGRTAAEERRAKEQSELDRYNSTLRFIERADPLSLPTESELEARIVDFTPARKEQLRSARNLAYTSALRDFEISSGEARRLGPLVGTADKATGKIHTAESLSKGKNHLRINPETGLIESLIGKPRKDAVYGPQEEPTPRAAEGLRDFNDVRRGLGIGAATAPRMADISGQPLSEINMPFRGSFLNPVPQRAFEAEEVGAETSGTGGILGLPGRLAAADLARWRGAIEGVRGIPGRIADYMTGQVLPPVASRLNKMEIGPDLTGLFPQYPITSPALPIPPRPRQKGLGYFGELGRPDGRVSTELSIGVNFDGREQEIPSIVPTLNEDEVNHLLSGGQPTESIIAKAVSHARERIRRGQSPFAQTGEQAPRESDLLAPPQFAPQY